MAPKLPEVVIYRLVREPRWDPDDNAFYWSDPIYWPVQVVFGSDLPF